ncbi:flagellar hook-basal body complex protein FliE [Aminobacter aganoensis]|uniref:Flagellar hook-basal body complex protein FliE n=1 Tax=Aminobacter aganoensis TaxID=83264 RepID=A0A7X0KLJ3_9HYPH|nr:MULTISPECIES: flagellar hook-basal body complex protein FliE [Aminobacter]KQU64765.1 flagellar hook-basal body protein FliE [Aminobacter sp. DSM 101952]MBB6355137.1 flagellar hook-basal body complex protein FliE [Aminobacter aganoensis]
MIGSISPLGQQILSKPTSVVPEAGAAATAGVASSFAAALSDAAAQTAATLRQAEQLSIAGLQGKADTREVVDAVMSAEQSLQAAIAIRDKIVTAYLEVSRMGI